MRIDHGRGRRGWHWGVVVPILMGWWWLIIIQKSEILTLTWLKLWYLEQKRCFDWKITHHLAETHVECVLSENHRCGVWTSGILLSNKYPITIPIGSMYGIFTYIWLIFMVNLGKYTIRGSYGIWINLSKLPPRPQQKNATRTEQHTLPDRISSRTSAPGRVAKDIFI